MLHHFFQTGSIFGSGSSSEKYAAGGGIPKIYRLVPQKERISGIVESVGEMQVRVEGDYDGAIEAAKKLLASNSDFVEVHVTKLGKNVLSAKKVAIVKVDGVAKLEDGGAVGDTGTVEGDWSEDKFEDGGRVYKLGDKWSSDFDDEGMLEFGSEATIELGVEKLKQLYKSFESVNYATAAKPLWSAIKLLEAGNEYEAKQSLQEFRIICKEEIIEMNTPDTFEKGGGVGESSEFQSWLKNAMKETNKWHFYDGMVNGNRIQIKMFVGVKEVDVQVFNKNGLHIGLKRNSANRTETKKAILSALGIMEDGGTIIESYKLPASDTTPIGKGGIPNYNTPLDINELNEEMIYVKGGGVATQKYKWVEAGDNWKRTDNEYSEKEFESVYEKYKDDSDYVAELDEESAKTFKNKVSGNRIYFSRKYDFSFKKGGEVSTERYIISYLNKDNGFKKTEKVFASYNEAVTWGRENLERFNSDMIQVQFKNGGSLKANDLAIGSKIKHKTTGVTVKVWNVNPETGLMQCERDGVKFPQWRSAKDYELVKK